MIADLDRLRNKTAKVSISKFRHRISKDFSHEGYEDHEVVGSTGRSTLHPKLRVLRAFMVSFIFRLRLVVHQRNFRFHAVSLQLFQVDLMNLRRLLFERNHLVQLGPETVLTVLRAAAAHREMSQRRVAGVEMT